LATIDSSLTGAYHLREMERNVRLLLSYDGTEFHGWQRQPGFRTVQGVLEENLRRVLRHPVRLIGSGRTDAGVHAIGQVANVLTSCTIPSDRLRHAIGSRLPHDLCVREATDVSPKFHANQSSLSKLYRYRIFATFDRPVTRLVQRYAYHFWERIDVDAMRAAARHFVGEMDFTSMAAARCVRATMVRRVLRCDVVRCDPEITVDVEGTGFLYNQVRNMVGTLIEVGRGRWSPDRVRDVLAACDRTQAGPTAPAHGLTLRWVRYPPELLCAPDGESQRSDSADSREIADGADVAD
jgi:tRNA pseudouridine38-40 synthase